MSYNPNYQPQPLQPVGPVGVPPLEIKWSGLSRGGAFKVPVVAFIGRLTEMVEDAQSQFGLRIVEKYDQIQILESSAPWPWATIDISIKYSGSEESAWGRHVSSAKSLGLAQNAASLEQAKVELVGRIFELRQKDESYGEDAKTGQAYHGDVWRFIRMLSVVPTSGPIVQPQVQPMPVTVPTPVPVYVQPQTVAQPAIVPAPVYAQPMPVPASAVVTPRFDTTLLQTDTAPLRAKKLLHGRALNEFLGVALVDPVVKGDPAFVNAIFDQSFLVGLKAGNQVVLGADGKFQVVG